MTVRSFGIAVVFVACLVSVAAPQTPPVETNDPGRAPLSCWWMTDRSAVRVGQPFGLTLTCRVLETTGATVVPNFAGLEPSSIELTPFETLDGARHEDIVSPPWRYVQYTYTVRLLGDEFFGRDVAVPATNLTFRVQTGGAETVEGVEHRYVLPAMSVRVLSLLPTQTTDLADPTVGTFGELESRGFRATVELVAAAIFFGFAIVAAIVAGFRVAERYRRRQPVIERAIPARAVLNGCAHEVDSVRAEALRDGWSSALAARALAPFRVGGAIALKQPIAQTWVAGDTPAREGQLTLRDGLVRRRHAIVSASITAEAMEQLRASRNGRRTADPLVLDRIRAALVALNAVRYGRERTVDGQELDRTLDEGCAALRQLRRERWWPAWRH